MEPKTRHLLSMCCALVGSFIQLAPGGVTWYWGNVRVYAESYFMAGTSANSDSHADSDLTWLISLYCICWTMGIMLSGPLVKLVGVRWVLLVAFLIFDGALFLGCLAVQHSVGALIATISFTAGVSSGVINGIGINTAIEWATDSHVGLVTAIITSSTTVGSIALNQLITSYVNPENLAPDVDKGAKRFFTQSSILNRVPSVFLMLGAFATSLHLLGSLILTIPHALGWAKAQKATVAPVAGADAKEEEEQEKLLEPSPSLSSSIPPSSKLSRLMMMIKKKIKNNNKRDQAVNKASIGSEELGRALPLSELDGDDCDTGASRRPLLRQSSDKQNNRDYATIELLKVSAFYILWIAMCCSDVAYITLVNFYKVFGQTWIPNDQFLTTTGICMSITSIATKSLWGLVIDRWGVKYVLIGFVSTLSLLSTWWYFTSMVGRWVYFVVTVLFGSINSSLYLVSSVGTLKLFGRTHFTSNFGAVISSGIVMNLVAPPVLDFLLHAYGWFYLFYFIGVLNAAGLMLVVFGLRHI